MECSGLTATSGTDAKDKAIGLLYYLDKCLIISPAHTHLLQGYRVTGRQQPHDDILISGCGRDCSHPQFEVQWGIFLEFYLTVLGKTPLRYVEIAHDLYPGTDGILIRVGYRLVYMANSINPEPDNGSFLTHHGLYMDIRGPHIIGINDHLIY